MPYADAVRELAAAHNLSIHSTFTGLAAYSWSQLLHPQSAMRAAATRWFERAIDFTARLGASGMGGHIGAFSVQDAANQERKQILLHELQKRVVACHSFFVLMSGIPAPYIREPPAMIISRGLRSPGRTSRSSIYSKQTAQVITIGLSRGIITRVA